MTTYLTKGKKSKVVVYTFDLRRINSLDADVVDLRHANKVVDCASVRKHVNRLDVDELDLRHVIKLVLNAFVLKYFLRERRSVATRGNWRVHVGKPVVNTLDVCDLRHVNKLVVDAFDLRRVSKLDVDVFNLGRENELVTAIFNRRYVRKLVVSAPSCGV